MNQVEVKRRQIQSWSYLLGLVAILLFGRMLGDNGIAYMAAAYECFAFLWVILGRNVPDALGRMLRGRSARGQYKNAFRVRRYAMLFQVILGLIGSLILAFAGGFLIDRVFLMPHGAVLAMVLAPAFFLRMTGAVLLGYFQGEGSELPTAVSGLLRQIFWLGFGLFFGNLLKTYGQKVSALLGQEDFTAMYGAMGVAVAAVLSEVLIVLFLLIVYRGSSRKAKNPPMEGMRTTDSFGSLLRILYGSMAGTILVQLFAGLPLWLGVIFLQKSAADKAVSIMNYGGYFGKYLAVCGIFLLLMDVMLISVSAKVHAFLKKDELRYARSIFQGGLHLTVVQGLFDAVFLTAMGSQLAGIFCESNVETVASMLSLGAFAVFFAGLADYFSRLLLLHGRWHLVLAGLGIMDIVFVICAVLFFNAGHLGIQSLIYAGLIAGGVLCAVLGFFACRQLGMGIDWLQSFAIPAGCACAVGLAALFLGKAVTPHLGNTVTVLLCLVVSFFLYWFLLFLFRNFREQELKLLPGGKLIKAFGRML